ncbi:unnamed protein product [Closterium sp. Yama58-4]|nr:unnamed protein product [Closterium sp. Yama58-4]
MGVRVNGLARFESDLQLLCRSVFTNVNEKSPMYRAARQLFALSRSTIDGIKTSFLTALAAAHMASTDRPASAAPAAAGSSFGGAGGGFGGASGVGAGSRMGSGRGNGPVSARTGGKREREGAGVRRVSKRRKSAADSDSSGYESDSEEEGRFGYEMEEEEWKGDSGRNIWSESEEEDEEDDEEEEDEEGDERGDSDLDEFESAEEEGSDAGSETKKAAAAAAAAAATAEVATTKAKPGLPKSGGRRASETAAHGAASKAKHAPASGSGRNGIRAARAESSSPSSPATPATSGTSSPSASSPASSASEGEEGTESESGSDAQSSCSLGGSVRPVGSKGSGPVVVVNVADEEMRRHWGNRMTRAAMVPPVTRQYEVIEEYVIVEEEEGVRRKMRVELPAGYAEKARQAQAMADANRYIHLELPEVREWRPRKAVGPEVGEQEVYGIDPYTHNLLLDTLPFMPPTETDEERHSFIEDRLLPALNQLAASFRGKVPLELDLMPVVALMKIDADKKGDHALRDLCKALYSAMRARRNMKKPDKYLAYRKGLGVVCKAPEGIPKEDFVVEFFGEVYPPWRWHEKQDGIRMIHNKEAVSEFYNILLERPKGDEAGYDVLVVDAMHRANFASRLCHSCSPNCEAKVVAVDGSYMIGVYAIRHILPGEELTFDYNSVTESVEEYKQAVCLCGHRYCKGSYLHLGGGQSYTHVISQHHAVVRRHALLLMASTGGGITEAEESALRRAGIGSSLLSDLPDWAIRYTALLMEFIEEEKYLLPELIVKERLSERAKQGKHRRPSDAAAAAVAAAAANSDSAGGMGELGSGAAGVNGGRRDGDGDEKREENEADMKAGAGEGRMNVAGKGGEGDGGRSVSSGGVACADADCRVNGDAKGAAAAAAAAAGSGCDIRAVNGFHGNALKNAGLGASAVGNGARESASGAEGHACNDGNNGDAKGCDANGAGSSNGDGDKEDKDARNEAEGVYLGRLQNLAITMDRVRYCLKSLYGDPKAGPPPLRLVTGHELVRKVWGGEGSVVAVLLRCIALHLDRPAFVAFRQRVRERTPKPNAHALKRSLLWLRDELLQLPVTAGSRNDAAADLIHLYAYTTNVFALHEYPPFDSPPMTIVASDLGRNIASPSPSVPPPSSSSSFAHYPQQDEWEWVKEYDSDYIYGQLIFWFKQTLVDPGKALRALRRGCLLLPDPSSCYSKNPLQALPRAYGQRERRSLLHRMEKMPEKPWPKSSESSIWDFRSARKLFGSPMLDAAIAAKPLDPEMVAWFKNRPITYVGPYDT